MDESSKKPAWQVSTKLRVRARSLRRNLTNAERIIWYAVRAHRLNGASFRRQAPIGPFIVDFACQDEKLIIEIDGGQHFEDAQEKRDARRDAFLKGKGYRVLRFNNHDVMTNRRGVLEAIDAALAASPSPPSPARGGGGADASQAAPPSLSLPRKGGGNPQTTAAQAASPSPPSPARGGGGPAASRAAEDSEPVR